MFIKSEIEAYLPNLPWKQDRNKWSVTRMDGFSKAGLNEIHFDLDYVKGVYRLAVGYGQREEVAAALETLRDRHPQLRDDDIDALTYRARHRHEVLRVARDVRETIRATGICRDVSIARAGARARTPVAGWMEMRVKTIFSIFEGGDIELLDSSYRNLLGDERDDIFCLGWSVAAAAAPEGADLRREHVVPLAHIMKNGEGGLKDRMRRGDTRAEVADFLMAHLGVVMITAEEQRRVDGLWADRMPDEWTWGGGRFARLIDAGITLV